MNNAQIYRNEAEKESELSVQNLSLKQKPTSKEELKAEKITDKPMKKEPVTKVAKVESEQKKKIKEEDQEMEEAEERGLLFKIKTQVVNISEVVKRSYEKGWFCVRFDTCHKLEIDGNTLYDNSIYRFSKENNKVEK